MVTSVIKRDGSIEEFNFDCIVDAAKRAYNSYGKEVPTKLFNHIKKHIEEIEDGKTPTVEDILDIMEESLGEIGEIKILRSFIQYRFRRKLKRETKRGAYKGTTLVDCAKTIWEYVKGTDWRIKANSNTGYSHAGLVKNTAGKVIANFWLDQVFSQEEGAAHRNGDMHIHDLDNLSIYCVGHSLRQLLNKGFGTHTLDRPQSKPPRHLTTASDQMVNFLMCLSHESAGAQAFSSVDTYLAPFVFIDELDQKQVTDIMESMIFSLNQSTRVGESVFSNYSMDLVVSEDLKNDVPMCDDEPLFARYQEVLDKGDVDSPLFEKATNLAVKAVKRGKSNLLELTYGDFQDEAEMIVIGFYSVLNNSKDRNIFTFPIPTINILPTFKWDSPVADAIFENAATLGSSYFQNFLGSQYRINPETGEKEPDPNAFKPSDIRSMCVTPDTMVHIKEVKTGEEKTLTIGEVFSTYTGDEYEILTPDGYKPIRKEFKLEYSGDVIKATLETSETLTTTLDHPWRVYNDEEIVEKIADEISVGDKVSLLNSSTPSAITKIEKLPYMGTVCDVEIETPEDTKLAHSFYANEILTGNCCRLQLDLTQLKKKGGGLFGAGEMTGSIGVVTINLARLGYVYSGDKHGLFKRFDELLVMAKSILEKRRKFCEELRDRGLYPYTSFYCPSWDSFFSTIGVCGGNEMCINFFKDKNITTATRQGIDFCKEVLLHLRKRLVDFQNETGNMYNGESSPAESASFRMAKCDKLLFPDIVTAGSGENIYYTNSTQLPVNYTTDIWEALDLQDELQTLYTGGTVLHYYHISENPDKEACKKIVKRLLETHRLPYLSLTPTFSVCPKHGKLNGVFKHCPICDESILQKYKDET